MRELSSRTTTNKYWRQRFWIGHFNYSCVRSSIGYQIYQQTIHLNLSQPFQYCSRWILVGFVDVNERQIIDNVPVLLSLLSIPMDSSIRFKLFVSTEMF